MYGLSCAFRESFLVQKLMNMSGVLDWYVCAQRACSSDAPALSVEMRQLLRNCPILGFVCAQRACEMYGFRGAFSQSFSIQKLIYISVFVAWCARNARVRAMRPHVVLKCAKCCGIDPSWVLYARSALAKCIGSRCAFSQSF